MGIIRKLVLSFLKVTSRDIKINHHLTRCKFLLNTYLHKGYWYYGKNRERNTIKIFEQWIKPRDLVLEIGGHIGYFSTFFQSIVGEAGRVIVFEPSAKNLKYLYSNISLLPQSLGRNIQVVEKGAGDVNEILDFYIDPITGQNNSFVKDFAGFFANRKNSAEENAQLILERVEVKQLDSFFIEDWKGGEPDFVKIDVEGFEWNVIKGFKETIEKCRPKLMIEIQADANHILGFFYALGYKAFNDRMEEIKNFESYGALKTPNIFFEPKIYE